jgi:hypothetical protein
MPDNTLSTLQQIIIKVRRLTRSMSEAQISTDEITKYVNTFILYDFPEHLRLSSLRTTLTFFTQPYIDTYGVQIDGTAITDTNDPLYNFNNRYITNHTPIYIAGYQSMYSQSREQFFSIYPIVNSIASIGTAGDGATTFFEGTIGNGPLLRNNVLISSFDVDNNPLTLKDSPLSVNNGALVDVVSGSIVGAIQYVTGEFFFTFSAAPATGAAINSQTVPYVASLPQALLFYDNKFTVRPVPDQAYRVQMEVFKRPDEMLSTGQAPELSEWWQYIAYGAAKKIFEDRMDPESVQTIFPEFKKQEALINRRTIVQQTDQRTSTIYTENVAGGYGSGWWNGGGTF